MEFMSFSFEGSLWSWHSWVRMIWVIEFMIMRLGYLSGPNFRTMLIRRGV
ncbi:MAG: hypothetical protein Hyperionvirus13_15 [Hyperionvirus sp.]|uniref:Uncharacterized protein n=1 Tax=Hyperionvirus sp. TaxID=2487770 RepID=A0A3G5ADA1_9VIRU|nr:MAG: hypothetical protein Hyperionvirus13_15 [Hyperionvirus sp.]